jgi:hypothetical protein
MQITIRNHRLLKLLGFEPVSPDTPAMASLSLRLWLKCIGWQIRRKLWD